jgi:hypothetical protein
VAQRVGDPDCAGRRIARQFDHQVVELALRAAADELPIVHRADTLALS